MATVQVPGRVVDGRVELPPGAELPEGAAVVVIMPEVAESPAVDPARGVDTGSVHPALRHWPDGPIGMWADREDMADSAEWVSRLRKCQPRPTDPD